nr:MAG TPA: hypothetical protein [Caudoviricetes sp.]
MNLKMKRTLPIFPIINNFLNKYLIKRDGINPVSFYFTLIKKYTPSL